jgi:superfamily II DNA/RNA helicase
MATRRNTNAFRRYQLDDRILDQLPKLGYWKPTAVQHQVIPLLLQKRNLIVEAATGTGKTAAYGLPLITQLDTSKRSTQMLVLVPSRELARQVEEALKSFTTDPKIRIEALYGGNTLDDAVKRLKVHPHILVAVPSRLKDVLRSGKFDFFWRDIKFLVIDEADKLMELGFMEEVDNLVSHVRNNVLVSLFSATISEDVEALIRERFAPVQVVRLSAQEALRNIRFHTVRVQESRSEPTLAALIEQAKVEQALIFCNKREEVYSLAAFLRSKGWATEAYHGLLDQVEREAVLRRFRHGMFRFLVATDLGARGLDVEELAAVVNFSFPRDVEVYLHRCGRTGRAGRQGSVYDLITSREEVIYLNKYHEELGVKPKDLSVKMPKADEAPTSQEVAATAGQRWVKLNLSRGKEDKIRVSDVAGFLSKMTGAEADQLGTIAVYDNYTLADVQDTVWKTLQAQPAPLKLKGKTVKVTRFTLEDQKRRAQALKKKQLGVRDKAKLKKAAEKRGKKGDASKSK